MTLTSPVHGYPLERITGSVDQMAQWVGQFDVVAEHLGAARSAAGRATGLPGMGKAVTRLRTDALEVLSTIGPHVALAQTLSSVLTAYANAHEAHASKANALIEEIETAHAAWKVLNAASDHAGRGALAASYGSDPVALQVAEDAAADAIADREAAEAALDDLWARYDHHFGAWEEAYDAAVRGLLGDMGALSSLESRNLLADLLAADAPADVLALWLSHPELHEELLAAHPEILGGMDGLPAALRVRANQLNAQSWIEAAQAELATASVSDERAAFLKNEIRYLREVESGDVMLYLYDRDFSRIVEVMGDLTTPPDRVITYVPGTFTSLDSFYGGHAQQVAGEMVRAVPGTLAFVYKDGLFPGENPDTGGANLWRILEANDQARAEEAGRQLARFEAGMRTDPLFAGVEHDAFGHSWGLANVTSAEAAGVEYDTVISLSGAGMPPDWEPDPETTYADLSYDDILQTGQDLGAVWDGNNPRSHPAFEHGDYYVGPEDEVLDQASVGNSGGYPSIYIPPDSVRVLMENHDLIASDDPDNRDALRDMAELVAQ